MSCWAGFTRYSAGGSAAWVFIRGGVTEMDDESKRAEPSDGDARLRQTLGHGVKQLLPELPAFRGITPLGELSVALSADGRNAQAFMTATQLGAALGTYVTRKKLYEKSHWVAKHLWVPPQQKRLQDQQVELKSTLYGVAAAGIVLAGMHGARKAGEMTDRARAAAMVDSLVTLSYRAPDGTLPECNAGLRIGVLNSFRVTRGARRRILRTPEPATLAEVGQLDIPVTMQETIAAVLFEARAGALGGTPSVLDDVQEFLVPVLMATKMSESDARALASARAEKYVPGAEHYKRHYQPLQAAVAGIGCDLGIPVDQIIGALMKLAEFDPYEAGRRDNRAIIGSLIASSGDLSALPFGGMGAAAIAIARPVAVHLLTSADAVSAGDIGRAWKRYKEVQRIY
jgi:hypothetical protein